jgi:hypothetical protein
VRYRWVRHPSYSEILTLHEILAGHALVYLKLPEA